MSQGHGSMRFSVFAFVLFFLSTGQLLCKVSDLNNSARQVCITIRACVRPVGMLRLFSRSAWKWCMYRQCMHAAMCRGVQQFCVEFEQQWKDSQGGGMRQCPPCARIDVGACEFNQ